ncbi:MAG: methionyl-tRNA formyltransferase [Bifidobacterium sp.]|nr:methionyl-tRNA formyltransferase [Bifidobacterium sp.]
MLRVLFAGTPEAAVPSLRMLAHDHEHFEVVAVLTNPDAPTGRGRKVAASPVKRAALELDLPVLESDPREDTFLSALQATGAQMGVVVAYGHILRQEVLDALPMGWVNLHFSLLPQWRGAAPVQRAIWAGEAITGTSVFQLTAGMDTGPVLAQSTTRIGAHETAGELLDRLAEDGAHLLAASLNAVEAGQITPVEQPEGDFEVAAKISHEDAHLRFSVPAFAVDRQVRACTPAPGAWCELHQGGDGETTVLHVTKSVAVQPDDENAPHDLKPGELRAGKKRVFVGTKGEALELLAVKPQGKKEMGAAEWARGARLSEGSYCD